MADGESAPTSNWWPGVSELSSFTVSDDGEIALAQYEPTRFRLGSTIFYAGTTGLEHLVAPAGPISEDALELARQVEPATMHDTDLASVPTSLNWFVGNYGVHTPAALIHDRLIGDNEAPLDEITDIWADRYFRFMLKDLGLPPLRRWLMWSAVALGTRVRRGGWGLAAMFLWLALSLAGTAWFAFSVAASDWLGAAAALLVPLPAGLLWGRHFHAAWLAAYCAPLILPPTVLGALGHSVYRALEWVISSLSGGKEPTSDS